MSNIQAILFDKKYYNLSSANKWIKKHGFKPIKLPHITQSFIRYRLKDPKKFIKLRIIRPNLDNRIVFIVGFNN